MTGRVGTDELNWILGLVSLALWVGAYGLYFARDLRVWFWRYRHRRELAELRRVHGYQLIARFTRTSRHERWRRPVLPRIPPTDEPGP